VSRGRDGKRTEVAMKPEDIAEIDFNFEAIKPYLKT
jgi:hypothetical protein